MPISKYHAALAERIGISQRGLLRLRKLADQAAEAQTEEHNTGEDSTPAINAFNAEALKLGLQVDWNVGLFPRIAKSDTKLTPASGAWIDMPD